jgi:hypothetical protein
VIAVHDFATHNSVIQKSQTIREVAFSSSNQRGRQIERSLYQDYVERNDARFYKYYQTYRLRQQIIEPIFGIFIRQWDLDYTILKTKEKVLTEYRIAGLAYNLMRLISEKGINWIEKRLKKLYFCIFDVRIIHRLSQQQYNELFLPTSIYHMATITALYYHQNWVVA